MENSENRKRLWAFILEKNDKTFYQKTAKVMFTLSSHFIYSFCKQFFACKAPNFVENCISIYATYFVTLHHGIFRETPSIKKGFGPLSLRKITKFLSEDCKSNVFIVITFYLLFLQTVFRFQSTKLCSKLHIHLCDLLLYTAP